MPSRVTAFYGQVLTGIKQHGQEFVTAEVEELSGNAENEPELEEKMNILNNVSA